jgi:putative restriction endonuclease
MRYWWVNQNQTYRQEVKGGYLWSPKRNANGARNPFYEFMREVSPGDLVFSFVDTRIVAIGAAASYCYESPKPAEFGDVGLNWEAIGWRVRVNFVSLLNKIRPKDHINVLRHVLPSRYSPLQPTGNGIQSVYLTELPTPFAEVIIGLIGQEAAVLRDRMSQSALEPTLPAENADVENWEHHIESKIESDPQISDTERQALIVARRGQGLFKQRVMEIEGHCRITGVTNPIHLRASHSKPWRDSTNPERLNGENGLLLTPTMDHLFDRGFISFEDSGVLIISPVAHVPSLNRMGIATDRIVNVGSFTQGQKHFLEYHRDAVLLQAVHYAWQR